MPLELIFFFTGLAAGTIDAIAGGGGLISVPVLLSLGLPPQLALGTNKLQSFCGTAVAAFSYYRQGWLQIQGLLLGLAFSAVGASLGAVATQFSSNEVLKKLIPCLLLLVFAYVIFSPRLGQKDCRPKVRLTLFYPLTGFALGFYDGFLGPGVGGFWVFLLMYFLGYSLLKATAYTKVFNLNSNLIALGCFAAFGDIDYRIGLTMAAGQIIGGRLGAQFAMSKGARFVRPLFLVMMLAAMVTLIYRDDANASLMMHWGFAGAFLVIGLVFLWKTRRYKALDEGS